MFLNYLFVLPRIYIVHDEVKDKAFDLELSWVGEITGGKHELVPPEVFVEAEKYAKVNFAIHVFHKKYRLINL